MTEDKRKFKGIWIPAFVYLNRDVSWNAKIIWLEIESFTSKGNDCFFSNKYLSEFLGCSMPQVTRYLTELKEAGWVEEAAFDGRKRYLRNLLDSSKMMRLDTQEGSATPIKSDLHNNSKLNIPNEGITDSEESVTQEASSLSQPSGSKEDPTQDNSPEAKPKTLRWRVIDVWAKAFPDLMVGFNAMQGKKTDSIIKKISAYCVKENIVPTDHTVLASFERLVNYVKKDDWYCGKDLSIIDSKFGTIVYEMKHGKKKDDYHKTPSANRVFGKYAHLK